MVRSSSFSEFLNAAADNRRPPQPNYDYWERLENLATPWPASVVVFCGGAIANGKESTCGCFAAFITRDVTAQPLARLFGVVRGVHKAADAVLIGFRETLRVVKENICVPRLQLFSDESSAVAHLGFSRAGGKLSAGFTVQLVESIRREVNRIRDDGGNVQFHWRCFTEDWRHGFKQGAAARMAVEAARRRDTAPYVFRAAAKDYTAEEASGGVDGSDADFIDG